MGGQEVMSNTSLTQRDLQAARDLKVGGYYLDLHNYRVMTYSHPFHPVVGTQYIFFLLDLPTWNVPIWDEELASRIKPLTDMEVIAWTSAR